MISSIQLPKSWITLHHLHTEGRTIYSITKSVIASILAVNILRRRSDNKGARRRMPIILRKYLHKYTH